MGVGPTRCDRRVLRRESDVGDWGWVGKYPKHHALSGFLLFFNLENSFISYRVLPVQPVRGDRGWESLALRNPEARL